ncbi:hypothetical protein [Paramagnetospirillum magneticum]|nr:hypothetical protein [Paramagnetospirillum magneticum]
MTVKGGRKGKFSTKRMAMMPRWGKARPGSTPHGHLALFERLTLRARRRADRTGSAAVHEATPLSIAPVPDLPPSLMAERAVVWSKGALRAVGSAASALVRRATGALFTPFRGLVDGMRSAFAPVTAEGDRGRGAAAFHGPPQRAAAPAGPDLSDSDIQAVIASALAGVPDKGDPTHPADLAALASLLSSPPPRNDFQASDLVRDCFASQGVAGLQSRALLGVALHLTREFGLPTRLPLASDRAWRMLDPVLFEDEMAAQLAGIRAFISDWQKTQQTFLVLEFAEIELIEWLFECLHPARHSDLLFEVMNFKVLSNRRQGILRRIPHRVRKFVKDAGGGHEAVLYAAGARAYLDRLVTTHGFTPIVETASLCLEEVDKVLEKLKPPAALPGPGGEGEALARITPVKMPASELADRAMAPAPPAAAQRPAAAPPPPPAMPVAPVAPQPLSSQPLPPRPQGAAPVPVVTSSPAAVPQATPQATGNVRPATIRLLPKHIRAGAELTIPSRSAGRIPWAACSPPAARIWRRFRLFRSRAPKPVRAGGRRPCRGRSTPSFRPACPIWPCPPLRPRPRRRPPSPPWRRPRPSRRRSPAG